MSRNDWLSPIIRQQQLYIRDPGPSLFFCRPLCFQVPRIATRRSRICHFAPRGGIFSETSDLHSNPAGCLGQVCPDLRIRAQKNGLCGVHTCADSLQNGNFADSPEHRGSGGRSYLPPRLKRGASSRLVAERILAPFSYDDYAEMNIPASKNWSWSVPHLRDGKRICKFRKNVSVNHAVLRMSDLGILQPAQLPGQDG